MCKIKKIIISRAGKFDSRIMKIEIEFLTYKPSLQFYTDSSKEEFSIPSYFSFENPIPTSLYIAVNLLGQKEAKTQKIVFRNGLTKQSFQQTLLGNDPLFLSFEDKTPAKITILMNEQVLYNQYAVCEIWNGDNNCLMGKFFLPLFSIKVNKKIREGSPSSSSPGSKKSFKVELLEDEIYIQKLKAKLLPMPIAKECDVINYEADFILGSVDVCAFISGELDPQIRTQLGDQQLGKQQKSKIISEKHLKLEDINIQQSLNNQTLTQLAFKNTSQINSNRQKQVFQQVSQQEKIRLLKLSVGKSDIFSSKLQMNKSPEIQSVIQVSLLKEKQKASFIKQIVDKESFTQLTQTHCLGEKQFFAHLLSNDSDLDCIYSISIDEINPSRKFGKLVLIVDHILWTKVAEEYNYNIPSFNIPEGFNVITEMTDETTNLKFFQIRLKKDTELQTIFYYDPTEPCDQSQEKSRIQKNMVRVLVRSSIQNFQVVGGFNVQIEMKLPKIKDSVRYWMKANKEIRIELKNPKIYQFNFRNTVNRYTNHQLFSPNLNSLKITHETEQLFTIQSSDQLKVNDAIVAYLIEYANQQRTQISQVCQIILYGCETYELCLIQGLQSSLEIPIIENKAEYIHLRSGRPKEVFIPEQMQNGIKVIPGILLKVPLHCITYSEQPSFTKVTVSRSESTLNHQVESLTTLLIKLIPQQPFISALYDVQCEKGKEIIQNISYKNKIDNTLIYRLQASHSQLKVEPEILILKNLESRILKCIFVAEHHLNKVQIKLFLTDEISNQFDCLMFRVNYLSETERIQQHQLEKQYQKEKMRLLEQEKDEIKEDNSDYSDRIDLRKRSQK